ncbi:MAG: dihydropteroate synthase [Flammeovirgaceae bacterium]
MVIETKKTLNIRGRLLDLAKPKVMGVINVTPDSFYDGGRFINEDSIILQADKLVNEGVDIIDIGGYSSRPGAHEVSEKEEIQRVYQAISLLKKSHPRTPISVDTFRADVAKKAVEAGAALVNDISGGTLDEDMFHIIAELRVPYIMMHMRGTPRTMQKLTQYEHILEEIIDFFRTRIKKLHQLGVYDIVVDPGFGFAKTLAQNYYLLNHLQAFEILECPILAGLSRKSMIYKQLGITPQDALNGTTVLNTIALQKGASILRVHDVKQAKEAIQLVSCLNSHKELMVLH